MTQWKSMTNVERAAALYKAGGISAVHTAVTRGFLNADGWEECGPCGKERPIFKNRCLICSLTVAAEDSEPEPEYVAEPDELGECEYCGTREPARPEPNIPGEFYCPNCKGVR